MAASWTGQDIAVTITDDGPGFAPEIMDRIGEPYVTSRRRLAGVGHDPGGRIEKSGFGLGFFIAKTLLERSGATLDFRNRVFPRARRHRPDTLGAHRIRTKDRIRDMTEIVT